MLSSAFLFTTALAIGLFARASSRPWFVGGLLGGYALLQLAIGATGFYANTSVLPPRFFLNVLPGLAAIGWLFFTGRGRRCQAGLARERLLWVHVVRVPVELVLYGLFLEQLIPEVMTFAGRNFDILAGLTAPLVWWLRGRLPGWAVRLWHVAGLLLLTNIVATAILAAPFPFQQLAFEQPNVGVLQAPYNLLPAVVVPLVYVAHFVGISRKGSSTTKP